MVRVVSALLIAVNGISFACQVLHICLDHVEAHPTSEHALEGHTQLEETVNHLVVQPHGSESIRTVPECEMAACGTQRGVRAEMSTVDHADLLDKTTSQAGQAEQRPSYALDPPPPRVV